MIRFYSCLILLFFIINANAHHAATGIYERDVFGEIKGEII